MADLDYLKFVFGGIFGMLAATVLLVTCDGSSAKIAHDALEQCEATLPRNQYCEITAVPKSEVPAPTNVKVE
jgi:hypothetical protein